MSLLIITFASTFIFFWVKANIVVELILNLNLDILPRELCQFYFFIDDLDNVNSAQVIGLDHSFRFRLKISEKLCDFIWFFMTVFAGVVNGLRLSHSFHYFFLNELFEFLCDSNNVGLFRFWTQDEDFNNFIISPISLINDCDNWLKFVTSSW